MRVIYHFLEIFIFYLSLKTRKQFNWENQIEENNDEMRKGTYGLVEKWSFTREAKTTVLEILISN